MESRGACVGCSCEAHVSLSVEQDQSIETAQSAFQQPSYCTLEDCFQLYTREERVCMCAVVNMIDRSRELIITISAA